ncbi:RtcB family protein [Candidatus Woesearchaeota archaeon]|nr:RtcB family protein [Candidatus Woesearchaeota archaeon]MBT5397027.1 RtcB family protein [Candidatus Woesearchaeota archaeon]MBT6367427.1 RtcB family protein [Candidatus Woesearchaeota archaeon]MBT7762427.1 RtcB family protein [Candidatus Woesearchaeota archaeon]
MEHQKQRVGPPSEIIKVSDTIWEIPKTYKKGMRVPARIIASEDLINAMDAGVFEQVTNVATLPGIQEYAYCMPDGHWGYGFPIGGVAAFDPKEGGIISPGGIGFDINCGMRLITTNLTEEEVKPKIRELVDALYMKVPAGVGCKGFVKITKDEFKEVMVDGAQWCLTNGYATEHDIEHIENRGKIEGADVSAVSEKAIKRGFDQIGTLGSGNHYLEIQVVDEKNVHDWDAAKVMGITKPGQVVIMVHCGSRGFGHQIGTDYLRQFLEVMPKYNIEIRDRELACAPFNSPEGQSYYKAMACAANMAFANRQVILHRIREVFSRVFDKTAEEMEMKLVYDVAHNIAKLEKHTIDGVEKELLVHRKGATRAFGPSRGDDLPDDYKTIGQPIILGGSMETGSWLLLGTDTADETFASTAHGAGRIMSRMAAKNKFKAEDLLKKMELKGIYVHPVTMKGVAEEAGGAYKDVNSVVDSLEKAGITKKVVSLRPIGNVKG